MRIMFMDDDSIRNKINEIEETQKNITETVYYSRDYRNLAT